MSLILKDPQATLDYEIDWGADYLDGDALSGSEWDVSPQHDDGPQIVSSRYTLSEAAATVSGGRPGMVYRLTNRIETMEGRSDARSIVLRVEAR